MATHTIEILYKVPGLTYSRSIATTDETETNNDTVIPASSTDYVVTLSIPTVADLRCLMLNATAAMTVTPYNGASAGTPITLAANTPFVWSDQDEFATNPISVATVTAVKVTSSAGGIFTFKSVSNAIPT
jgi:hypothetical protein